MDAVKEAVFEQRIDNLNVRVEDLAGEVERRFEQVDQRFEQVDRRFEQVDQRFDQVDYRFDQVNVQLDQVNKRFERLEGQFDVAEERRHQDQVQMRAEINGLRGETAEGLRELHRLLFRGMTSFIVSIIASVAAVIVAHAL